jgi:hypothetical protein
MDAWLIGIAVGTVVSVFMSVGAKLAPSYEDFVKEHNKSPYCITREIGAETIKKCYIATEVK